MPEGTGSTRAPTFGGCGCAPETERRNAGGHVARFLAHALQAESHAGEPGLLQARDARFKVGAMLLLILSATWAHHVATAWCLVLLVPVLAVMSKVPLRRIALQAYLPVLVFTGLIAAPALFLVPGPAVAVLPVTGWAITANGLTSAAMLMVRAGSAAGLALLLVLTTPWSLVVKALGALGVPAVITAMLAMTQRYIFIFLQTAADMHDAMHSRVMAPMAGARRRQMIVSVAGVLFTRSLDMGQNVHEAMIARGYRGQSLSLDCWHPSAGDAVLLGLALVVFVAVVGLHL